MMIMLQLRTLLGLPASPLDASASPIRQAYVILMNARNARWEPLMLGAIVVVISSLTARRWPRSPAALGGVVLAVAFAWFFGWRAQTVGVVSADFPAPATFSIGRMDLFEIVPSALGLAFVTAINVLITSRVVDHFRGRHRPRHGIDADIELGAYGVANLCGGAFGAPMSVGIPARSLANVRCGGTTRFSGLFHAIVLIALIRFGSGAMALVPLSALAGVTAYVGLGLMEWSTWRRLPRMRRVDAAAFLATAAAVVAANAVAAVTIGCSFYLIRYVYQRFTQAIPGLQTVGPPEADP
jgi:SulP family sulfate permease